MSERSSLPFEEVLQSEYNMSETVRACTLPPESNRDLHPQIVPFNGSKPKFAYAVPVRTVSKPMLPGNSYNFCQQQIVGEILGRNNWMTKAIKKFQIGVENV